MIKPFYHTLFSFSLLACGGPGSEHAGSQNDSAPASTVLSSKTEERTGSSGEGSYALISAGNMQSPRAAHTATLLKNGTVLICGGFAGGTSLATAEIYDPVSKTFSPVEGFGTARAGHSSSLLPDGRVLIAGGYNGSYLAGTEIYDPAIRSFSKGPDMTMARSGHTATRLADGSFLIAGGVGTGWSFLSSAEIYDVKTRRFLPVGSMTVARESHTATLLKDGNVLITGGHRGRRENLTLYSECEVYNRQSGRFQATGSLRWPRHKHDAVLLADGRVLVVGGSDQRDAGGIYTSAELFDPRVSRFTETKTMTYPRYKLNGTSILLADSIVLIAGGADKAETYSVATGTFRALAGNMGSARLFSAATLLKNGNVLITGGYDEANKTSEGAWLVVKNKGF